MSAFATSGRLPALFAVTVVPASFIAMGLLLLKICDRT